MTSDISRRRFLQATAITAATQVPRAAGMTALDTQRQAAGRTEADRQGGRDQRPVVIASENGLRSTARASELILDGADALDAVIAGVNIVEADPEDWSVGLGGLPNEDGIVELDASVMHGPTHQAGAVAALRNIVHPSRVARLVMERTDHVLLVGQGALRFARAHGFKEQDLLTDESRQAWLRWKERLSEKDDWIAPPAEDEENDGSVSRAEAFTYGTINCCAVDANGNLGGVTTTSGLSYKIPGRVGDSPIIGAGLYVDNEAGAAGATGRGEAVILNSGSFAVVQSMAAGRSPQDACLEVLKRIADRTKNPRLLDDKGRPDFQVIFYAVNKDGHYGSAAIWSESRFSVCDRTGNRCEDSAYLWVLPPSKRKPRRRRPAAS